MASSVLRADIDAYETMRDQLDEHHAGKFVVFHDGQFFDAFDNFDNAAKSAIESFGDDDFLIREVGMDRVDMPLALAYGLTGPIEDPSP